MCNNEFGTSNVNIYAELLSCDIEVFAEIPKCYVREKAVVGDFLTYVISKNKDTIRIYNEDTTSADNKLIINWGDGSPYSTIEYNYEYVEHTYANNLNNRVIKIGSPTGVGSPWYDCSNEDGDFIQGGSDMISCTFSDSFAFTKCEGTFACTKDSFLIFGVPIFEPNCSLNSMFYNSDMNININHWDVSNVVNLSYMFYSTVNFNQPLNNWDVSSVVNMRSMFRKSYNFNQPLNNWDVSNVTSIAFLFSYSSFNQDISEWNTSNVETIRGLFSSNSVFNKPLNDLDISNTVDISSVFSGAVSFNQDLNLWNTASVANMNSAFYNAHSFNQDISNWNTALVENMDYMFDETDYCRDLSAWDTSSLGSTVTLFGRFFCCVDNDGEQHSCDGEDGAECYLPWCD
ncbi:MAG: BspA family leucine-rich repeat surface protein [Campylobacterota bacterium]|nr:BspA family leucine-rich repeat surface protein [Campylobacterota bacterium]